jgi:hypothetical protein
MAAVHEERFIPPRQKLDQLSIVKDYAAVPRLEYRYVLDRNCLVAEGLWQRRTLSYNGAFIIG